MPLDETYVGSQAIFKAGGQEFPITNVELTVETQTSQIQQETSFDPTTAISGMRYSGSFEYSGLNNDWIDTLFEVTGSNKLVQPKNTIISIDENNGDTRDAPAGIDLPFVFKDGRRITIRDVTITNIDRSLPADDVATTTFQFVADTVDVKQDDIR